MKKEDQASYHAQALKVGFLLRTSIISDQGPGCKQAVATASAHRNMELSIISALQDPSFLYIALGFDPLAFMESFTSCRGKHRDNSRLNFLSGALRVLWYHESWYLRRVLSHNDVPASFIEIRSSNVRFAVEHGLTKGLIKDSTSTTGPCTDVYLFPRLIVSSINIGGRNRVLVTKPHNKTPYELLHGRPPSISIMRPFGCPVTILNTLNPQGKFDGKADEGFLVGYSINSKLLGAQEWLARRSRCALCLDYELSAGLQRELLTE
ncbi:hypothetical protein Tco_0910792 [Tanacetum coccineum]|uniref:Uncharacterized protein n=1 Tax=Tanacetum coccineum TaxID=301880 RepID=A0ABQ5CVK4_9ASTR